jgi:cytochrome c oxidase subunit 2
MFGSQTLSNMQLPSLPLAGFWFGESVTTNGANVDTVFAIINWICLFFFVLVVGLMAWFVFKYRARPGHTEQPSPSHNNSLEIIWSVIPILLVALIFFLGFTGFMDMRNPPVDSYDIRVVATQWNWQFIYPGGISSDELHVPVGRPVRLVQESRDVLHSLYVPAFRIKMDVVPGRYTYQWFQADKAGRYDLFCAEYCGKDHSNMNTFVEVHDSEAAFLKKLEELNQHPDDLREWGKKLWEKKGCMTCHSIDGTPKVGGGPSWKDLWDKEEKMADGSTQKVDYNYIVESIRTPQKHIVAGFAGGIQMAPYAESQVKSTPKAGEAVSEMDAIIAFIQSLAKNPPAYIQPKIKTDEAAAADGAAATTTPAADTPAAETPAPETPAPDTPAPSTETGSQPAGEDN